MIRKLLIEMRGFLGGMIITFMMLLLCSDRSMGGTEVNGIIGFIIWLVLLWIMRNRSTFGAVITSMVVYCAVDIIKFGFSKAVGIEIVMIVIVIGMVYYMKISDR